MLFKRGRRAARRLGILVATTGLVALLIPATASAGGNGATIVRGIQQAYGSCGAGTGYAMDGALEGCWWVDTFVPKQKPGGMLATGTEHFEGCLGLVCGTFTTTYSYTASFDGTTELHGRCHHPITGGTGGFAGARGELSFTDVVDHDPFYYPYWGNIRLAGGAGALSVAQPTPATARPTSTTAGATAPC